jgi:NADH:ubiquinone oxidoreductase subunit H
VVSPQDVARQLRFDPASGLPAVGCKFMLPLALMNLLVTGGTLVART